MSLITILPILAKSLSKGFARTSFFFVLLISLRDKLSSIRAYLALTEKIKKQEEAIHELTSRLALKDRIISIISHDIRSPLNTLKSLLELLSERHVSQDEFHKIASNLNVQVGQLSQFLENLLKWIRNMTTEIKPRFELIPLHHIVNETIGLFALEAERKQIDLKSHVLDSTVIYADEEMVKLVLRNLTNNAIKFCNSGDRISIDAKESLGEVCVIVEDTGQGIPEENIPKLFEFSHLSTLGTKNEIGTGLGLSLCKEFIKKMGGKITAQSAEGEGSRFEFTIHSPSSPSYEFLRLIERQE